MIESPREWVKARACSMKIRVRKQDAAYLYQVLESYEGLASYSTVSLEKDLPYRDIALHIAPDLRAEVELLVGRLSREIPLELLA
jgi:hypothetical protein